MLQILLEMKLNVIYKSEEKDHCGGKKSLVKLEAKSNATPEVHLSRGGYCDNSLSIPVKIKTEVSCSSRKKGGKHGGNSLKITGKRFKMKLEDDDSDSESGSDSDRD